MCKVGYRLFIDDERYPSTPDWFVARNSYDAIYALSNYGLPTEIAFDHDLGGEDTAIVFIKWLISQLEDATISLPEGGLKYSIHSQNPIGAENIRSFMENINKYF